MSNAFSRDVKAFTHVISGLDVPELAKGEALLWRNVIMQAFRDYVRAKDIKRLKKQFNPKKGREHCELVNWRTWLRSKDFQMVCDVALLEPSWVRSFFMEVA